MDRRLTNDVSVELPSDGKHDPCLKTITGGSARTDAVSVAFLKKTLGNPRKAMIMR